MIIQVTQNDEVLAIMFFDSLALRRAGTVRIREMENLDGLVIAVERGPEMREEMRKELYPRANRSCDYRLAAHPQCRPARHRSVNIVHRS